MKQYTQHWIVKLWGDKQDGYTFYPQSIGVDFNSFLGFRNRTLALPYTDIEEVRTNTSLMGWLLGYCNITIRTEEREYFFEKIGNGKQMAKDLTSLIS